MRSVCFTARILARCRFLLDFRPSMKPLQCFLAHMGVQPGKSNDSGCRPSRLQRFCSANRPDPSSLGQASHRPGACMQMGVGECHGQRFGHRKCCCVRVCATSTNVSGTLGPGQRERQLCEDCRGAVGRQLHAYAGRPRLRLCPSALRQSTVPPLR